MSKHHSNENLIPFSNKANSNQKKIEISSEQVANHIIELALDQKALDTVGFDVHKVSSLAKFIIIASGTSSRHVKGIADKIKDGLEPFDIHPSRTDGYDEGEWVVIDYDDIIVHLFFEPKRQYYEFDALMNGAEKLVLSQELKEQVRQFKTGLHQL